MSDCIFCKIARGDIPCAKVFEDGEILGFADIHPKAPVHCLIIPKAHLPTLDDADDAHQALLGKMMLAGAQVAREKGVAEKGYRLAMNVNPEGGQEVFHVHLHLLGGRPMGRMG
jgi:histidine triad (HIT) family protein